MTFHFNAEFFFELFWLEKVKISKFKHTCETFTVKLYQKSLIVLFIAGIFCDIFNCWKLFIATKKN